MMNRYLPRLMTILALSLLFSGCAAGVKHTLYERYEKVKPSTAAVLPVVWDNEPEGKKEAAAVAGLFRQMSFEKIASMGYKPQPLDETDKRLAGLNPSQRPAKDALAALKTDSALLIRIIDWDSSMIAAYSSLKVKALFELYSKDGELLWKASYSTKESDAKLDVKPMELAVLKAYEPRVQRFVDMVLSTLPRAEEPPSGETFFEWLP